jgi:hypothetical protein
MPRSVLQMFSAWKSSIAAASIFGALLSLPSAARADSFGFSVGPAGGIGFSYESGGYCDRWGCPDDFWDYPVSYCPVYFDGDWYRGPMYYRNWGGRYYFWIHGGWHSDDWDVSRPDWACSDEFGPALSYEWYDSHGFRWRDDWRQRWYRSHNEWNRSRADWENHAGSARDFRSFDTRHGGQDSWTNGSGWNAGRRDHGTQDTRSWGGGDGSLNRGSPDSAAQGWRGRGDHSPATNWTPDRGSAMFAPREAFVPPPQGRAVTAAPSASTWLGNRAHDWSGRQPGTGSFTPNTASGAAVRDSAGRDHRRDQDSGDGHGRWQR